MKTEPFLNNFSETNAEIRSNIEKIASAKKYLAFDNDLAIIYKSTDCRNSQENREFLEETPKNLIKSFSPATIKYIESQSSKLSQESEKSDKNRENRENTAKMSLSPGNLLEDVEFYQENSRVFAEKYKKRLTEFGVKNILSVIQENSCEKDDEKAVNSSNFAESFSNLSNLGEKTAENKENCAENSQNLSLSLKKSVIFAEEERENSSFSRKKYQKTPIINKIRKRNYEEIEKDSSFENSQKKLRKVEKTSENIDFFGKIAENTEKIAENTEKIAENIEKTAENIEKNRVLIENSPLNAVQKNKLIEILSSNCKKPANSLENSLKSLISCEKSLENDGNLIDFLREILRKKMQFAQEISCVISAKRKNFVEIQTKNHNFKKTVAETKEKLCEITAKMRGFQQKHLKILSLKQVNFRNFQVFGIKILDVLQKNSQNTIKFTLFDEEFVQFFVEYEPKTANFLRFYSKTARNTEKLSFFCENMQNFERVLNKSLISEKSCTLLRNCYEILNKIAFFLNSFAIFSKTMEILRKSYDFTRMELKSEVFLEFSIKYCNFDEKYLVLAVNLCEWFNEIGLELSPTQKFSENCRNQINTVYNAEITKPGLEKLQKIIDKIFFSKLKLRN